MIASCIYVILVLLPDFLAAEGTEKLRIFPEQNGIPMVRTVGKSFALTCQGPKSGGELSWEKDGARIQLDSQGSVRAKMAGDKLMVYSTKSDTRDSGTYTCRSGNLTKEMRLIILEPASWLDSTERVGSPLGTRLAINCDATGNPPPKIRITNSRGAPFVDQRFVVTENRGMLIVTALQESDQDLTVVCVAAQTFTEGDFIYPIMQTKEVRVDVYLEPQFESPKIDRYGIVGRNASLTCQVTRTNPPLTGFDFQYEDREIPSNSEKFKKVEDLPNNKAVLHINKVTREDFGKYICIAKNPQVVSSGLIISLSETNPPGPVQAKCMETGLDFVAWEIDESASEGAAPVTEYRVEYIRESLIQDKDPAEIESMWRADAAKIHFKKSPNPDALYTISSLRPRTTYRFRFRAVSEAGWGDMNEFGAATISSGDAAASKSGYRVSPATGSLPLLLTQVFVVVFLCVYR